MPIRKLRWSVSGPWDSTNTPAAYGATISSTILSADRNNRGAEHNPFSLAGQPSACGPAREVGTFSHRLLADIVVVNKDHRDKTEKIWRLPEGTISPQNGYHAVQQNRMLRDGVLNAYWVQVNKPASRRHWHQLVDAPDEARSDLWQLMELSERFKI